MPQDQRVASPHHDSIIKVETMKHTSVVIAFGVICGLTAGKALAESALPMSSWLTQPSDNHLTASRLKGLEVYNSRGEDIGDIDELLIDHLGKVDAVVVGVTDALGIAKRNIAVPFDQIEFVYRSPAPTAAADPTGMAPPHAAEPNRVATVAGPSGAVPRNTALENFSLSPVPLGVPSELTGRRSNVPDRALINLSADQLRAAPAFLYKPYTNPD